MNFSIFLEAGFHERVWSNSLGFFNHNDYKLKEVDLFCYENIYCLKTAFGRFLFNENFEFIEDSLLARGGFSSKKHYKGAKNIYVENDKFIFSPNLKNEIFGKYHTHIIDEAVFLGNSHPEFGHCLTESLSRLWCYDLLPKRIPLLFFDFNDNPILQQLLYLLKIDEKTIISNYGTDLIKFKKLYLPSQALNLYGKYSEKLIKMYNEIGFNANKLSNGGGLHKNIFLDRYTQGGRRNLKNREWLLSIYKDKGFTIIQPEKLNLMDQIALAYNAEHIAGVCGSQIHLGQFQQKGQMSVFGHTKFFPSDSLCISLIRNIDYHAYVADGNHISNDNVINHDFNFNNLTEGILYF